MRQFKNNDDGYYPLSAMQQYLITKHAKRVDSTMMNIGALLKLDRSIDIEKLAKSCDTVLNRYDVFHCRFMIHPITKELCQRFDGDISPSIVKYMSDEEFAERYKLLKRPYNIMDNPLYRNYFIETPTEKYWYIDFYHAAMDGTSIILFINKVDKCYQGKRVNRAISNFAQYIIEKQSISSDGLKDGNQYWENLVRAIDRKKFLVPIEKRGNSSLWDRDKIRMPIKNIVRDFFKGNKVSQNTFFLAAAMLAIAKMSGNKDAIMSWVHNGRKTFMEHRLMGVTLEEYPIRYEFGNNVTVERYLKDLQGMIDVGCKYRESLDVFYKQDFYLVSFILQKGPLGRCGTLMIDNKIVKIIDMPEDECSAAENPLDIEMIIQEDGTYSLLLDFDASLYSQKTMYKFARMIDDMILVLQDDKIRISDVLQ